MAFNKRRAGKALLVVAVLLIVVFLLLLPPTQDLLRKYLVDPFSTQYPEGVEMEVSLTMTIDANGGHITSYRLDLPLPVDQFSDGVRQQDVTSIITAPHYDQLLDAGGANMMVWEGDDLYSERTITFTVNLTQTLHAWDLDEDTVMDKDEISLATRDRYLSDEWKIVVNDPAIADLRQDVVGNETNVYLIARSIYDWIVNNVDYPEQTTNDIPKSSLQTLNDLEGDCDDQSILFCALARSAGVPAWIQLGAIYDRSAGTMGGHGWVQMCMPTDEGDVNVTIDIVNRNFLVWMPNLFCEYTDDGNGTALEDFYHPISITYDPSSYAPGETPQFISSWEVLSYKESDEKVTLSTPLMTRVED
ncbi:MAG: transglutaminase domain-containing protein [Methanomassiliicoccales archaeon]|nr:transglutaminase domain-containing protein [Methanomassiliicoccales archaeon]